MVLLITQVCKHDEDVIPTTHSQFKHKTDDETISEIGNVDAAVHSQTPNIRLNYWWQEGQI